MRLPSGIALLLILGAVAPIGNRLAAQRADAGGGHAVLAGGPRRRSPASTLRAAWSPRRPGEGSLAWVTVDRLQRGGDSVIAITGSAAGEPLHFLRAANGTSRALAAVPLGASDSVVARVQVTFASGATDSAFARLTFPHRPPPEAPPRAARARRARRLTVDRRFTTRMDSATEARVERENARAREVGRLAHETPRLWLDPFSVPRVARITSTFGSGRLFNGRVSSSHSGVDFAGHAGEPVHAANRGVIALVDSFFLAGNVVYVDHGAGVVTGYFHLSTAEVAVGDTVERGQEIGLVGATGRVTGPHLHWSARYGAITVDPMDLVTLTGGSTPRASTRATARRPRHASHHVAKPRRRK